MPPRLLSSMAVVLLVGCQRNKPPVPVDEAAVQPPVAKPVLPPEPPAVAAPKLPARGVAGVVTDEEGAQITGARVCAWTKRPPIEVTRDEMLTPTCADVDAHGGYALELGAGVWRLVASAAEREPGHFEVALRESNPQQVVDHELAPGGRKFSGRVLDNLGRPVVGARVTANMGVPPRDRGFVQTKSGTDGRFELHASHYGWLWIHAPGFVHDFFVPDGEDYVLIPESGVRGRVVDDRGKPVAGARVAVRDRFGLYGNREDATRTDAAGAFALTGLAPAAVEVVAVTAYGYGLVKAKVAYTKFEDVVVRLERLPTLRLQVVEPEVGPVAMCAVDLAPSRSDASDGGERYWTDQEGALELALRPGRYRIADVECRDKVAAPPFATLDLRRGSVSAKIEVTSGLSVRGIARTPAGEPMANEELWLRPPKLTEHIRPSTVTTDAAGRFEFHGLAPGTYTFNGLAWMAQPKDTKMPTVRIPAETASEVEVEFPASGRIEVQSSRKGWDQRARLRGCNAWGGGSWSDNKRSDRGGRAVFEHVTPGEVVVSVEDSPFCSSKTATRVQVGEGETHRVEIDAKEVATTEVVVHVEGPGGKSIAGALVQVSDGGEYLITTHPWGNMGGNDCAVTDQHGVARVEIETGSELNRIEALAPGLLATYGQPEADPDFDFGGEGEDFIDWPGLQGTEFTVTLAPAP